MIAAVLFGTAAFAFGQSVPNLPNDPATKVGKLENGMTYYIRHNDKPEGRAEFYLATNVGALQEAPDQDGLAHFLEHMCFNGTKNFPGKGILNWLESIGASFGGNVNASTGVEQTIYLLNNIPLVRPTVVDTCLLIMHDYSHFVTCDPKEIDSERGVILEESVRETLLTGECAKLQANTSSETPSMPPPRSSEAKRISRHSSRRASPTSIIHGTARTCRHLS